MTWGLSTATSHTPYSPYVRQIPVDRGGYMYQPSYSSHGGAGWSGDGGGGGGGGWSGGDSYKSHAHKSAPKSDNKAALSALTLLSFLFFLNLLQQQLLSTSGGQTLLFMVSGNGTTGIGGRRRRDALDPAGFEDTMEPLIPINEELLSEEEIGSDSSAGVPSAEVGWREASSRLRSLLPSTQLPLGLTQALSSCRSVVACTMHQATPTAGGAPFLANHVISGILAEAGEDTNFVELDDLCEDVLSSAQGECGELARTFATVLPQIGAQKNFKHDPYDFQ